MDDRSKDRGMVPEEARERDPVPLDPPSLTWAHVAWDAVRAIREALDSWDRTARLIALLTALGVAAGLLLLLGIAADLL